VLAIALFALLMNRASSILWYADFHAAPQNSPFAVCCLPQKNVELPVFKPPPPVGAGRGYMFSGRPSVPLSVGASVRGSRGSFMFPRYLQYLLTDFRQTFVTDTSRDRDELITFWGQTVKGQGHSMTEYIPYFHVSTISPVSIDRFSPNFCHWCILG